MPLAIQVMGQDDDARRIGQYMAQVTLAINGRSYRIGCADGEEARLRELGREVAVRVDRLVMEFGQVGETRLLLMAALLASDELLDVRANLDVMIAEAAERLHLAAEAARAAALPPTPATVPASPVAPAPETAQTPAQAPAQTPVTSQAEPVPAEAAPAVPAVAPEKPADKPVANAPLTVRSARPARIEMPGRVRSA